MHSLLQDANGGDDDDTDDASFQTLELEASFTLILAATVALATFGAYMVHKWHLIALPESVVSIVLGLIVGFSAKFFSHEDGIYELTPSLFYFVLLPPIIFDAGYKLHRKRFFRNIGAIFLYAVFGTLISTFVVGYGVYLVNESSADYIHLGTGQSLDKMLFGALISAVDPVATLAIMGELECDPMLYALVFGESVLNDAVSITLFEVIDNFFQDKGVTLSGIFAALGKFFLITFGSIAIGIFCALFLSFCMRRSDPGLRDFPTFEVVQVLMFAYISYGLAQAIGLSGIMSLFFAGITLRHYNYYNISEKARQTSDTFISVLANLAETLTYVYIGGVVATELSVGTAGKDRKTWQPALIGLTMALCLLGRALNIFPLSFIINLNRPARRRIPFRMQVVMWWAGLRGAVALALARLMPALDSKVYQATTLAIVLLTTVVGGGSTASVLEATGMRASDRMEDMHRSAASVPRLSSFYSFIYGGENSRSTNSLLEDEHRGHLQSSGGSSMFQRPTNPGMSFSERKHRTMLSVWKFFDSRMQEWVGGSKFQGIEDGEEHSDDEDDDGIIETTAEPNGFPTGGHRSNNDLSAMRSSNTSTLMSIHEQGVTNVDIDTSEYLRMTK